MCITSVNESTVKINRIHSIELSLATVRDTMKRCLETVLLVIFQFRLIIESHPTHLTAVLVIPETSE